MLEKLSSLFPGYLGNQEGEVQNPHQKDSEKERAKNPCPSLEGIKRDVGA